METIFRKVMCSDRLPKEALPYLTDIGRQYYSLLNGWGWPNELKPNVTFWLEEVPINTIKADAWDEGYELGAWDVSRYYNGFEEPNKPNPYK